MGLDIFFKKHRNSNLQIERAFDKFWDKFNEDMPVSEVRALAEKLGITDRLTIKECEYGGQPFVDASRNDTEEAAYFRKHNHLIPYFGYGENCSNLTISRNQLEQFIEDAKEVLSHEGKDDFQQVAAELIPTESGFFFGSVEYDEWYCNDLRDNIEAFQSILDYFDFDNDILYMHCWW